MGLSSALSFICIPLSVPFNKLSLLCHGTWDRHNKQIMNGCSSQDMEDVQY